MLILAASISCTENSTEPSDTLQVKPIVKKSEANYSSDNFGSIGSDSTYLKNLNEYYSENFSEDLRNRILDFMRRKVENIGENVAVFDSILSKTGCSKTGEFALPAYAEIAKFEGREAWIFQVTYGLGSPSFGHFKQFAFSVPELDTLYYFGCR
jgi:hypothetical protein